MIEDLAMEDDTRIIIKLIEDKRHDLDDETITSLTKYVETNLASLYRITEILTGIAAYRTLIKNEEEKIESLGGV